MRCVSGSMTLPRMSAAARAPASRGRRKWWLALCVLLAVVCAPLHHAASDDRPRLIVYLHTSIRARALESALEAEMPGIDVVVVGRYRDFERELADAPDAAMAVQPVLEARQLTRALLGLRAGEDTEPYVLMSSGAAVDLASLSGLTIGAVDLLSRQRTAEFVARLLNLQQSPQLAYVIKTDDLLSLLQFESAKAVLLSEAEATRLRGMSKLDLRVTPLPTRVGLVAVTFLSERGRNVVRPSILALSLETRRKLGVDAWR
jgi:hypothetical protein